LTGIHEISLLLGTEKKSLTLDSNPIWDLNGDKQNEKRKPVSNEYYLYVHKRVPEGNITKETENYI